MPSGPIKVGESWQVPPEKIEKFAQAVGGGKMKFDPKRSSLGGKLLNAYKKDGAQYGTLELTITLFITEIDFGFGAPSKTTAESKMVIKSTSDVCIDGTSPAEESTAVSTLDLTVGIGNGGTLTMKTTGTETQKVRAAK
jgi:hypothetical protein